MARKGAALTIHYTAWDTDANTPKTGDVANHTIYVIKDGDAAAEATNNPAEVDATNCKGEYELALTGDEMDANFVTICGVSSTSDIAIIPVKVATDRGWVGEPPTIDGATTIAGILAKIADDDGGADYDATTDSLERQRAAITLLATAEALATTDAVADAIKAKTDLINAGNVTYSGPVADTGDVSIVRGDDYLGTDATRALTWSSTSWPDLTSAAVKFSVRDKRTKTMAITDAAMTVVTPTGTAVVRVDDLTSTQTKSLTPGQVYEYDIEAVLDGTSDIVTLSYGNLTVIEDIKLQS